MQHECIFKDKFKNFVEIIGDYLETRITKMWCGCIATQTAVPTSPDMANAVEIGVKLSVLRLRHKCGWS